jgi:sodium/proline symporter
MLSTGLSYPMITEFIIYIAFVLIIGWMACKITKNISDYILGGRHLSGAFTALGAGASDMSGWLLMALPGAALVHGINQIWMPIGLAIGAYLNWQFEAKRLRIYTEVANDSLTVPAYFDNRFHDQSKVLRIVTALVVLFFFTLYAAAGFMAGGILTQNIFHLHYLPALFICASVMIAYTCLGGFLAISWIDFFQGTLMFFALLIVPFVTVADLHGIKETFSHLTSFGPHYLDAFHGIGLISIISLLAWGLGYFGQPHIIVRFMAVRSSREIPVAQLICMTWMVLVLYGSIFTGIAGAAYFKHQGSMLNNPETVFLVLSQVLFNPYIAGILIAAVLSAIMSTVSAQILSAASAITEDLYRGLRKTAKPSELMWIVRLCVLVIACVAVWIASSATIGNTILQLVAYAWSGLGAAFGPVILISLYWQRMTRNAAVGGIITGAITVIIWEILGKKWGGIFELYSILPGFAANTMAIYVLSKLDNLPNKAMMEQFGLMLKKVG